MADSIQTREIGRMWARADVVPESINEEARTVDVVWTTGARVKRTSWFDGPWYEELSTDPAHVRMDRLASGRAPVLLQHNGWNPDAHQGVVQSARLVNGRGTATLRFLTGDVDADKTWNKIRQRVLASVSVGYAVHKMEKIEGGDETIPVFRATDWEPYEISPVSMPADVDAVIRSEGGHRTLCQIITRGEAPQQKENEMPEEQKNTAPAQDEAARLTELESVRAAERERSATIITLVRKHGLGAELADKLVADGTSVDKARALVLDALAARSDNDGTSQVASGAPERERISAGEDARDKRKRGMSAWLYERSGKMDLLQQAGEHKKFGRSFKALETDGGEFRGMSLLDMARFTLEANGQSVRGLDRLQLVQRAIDFRSGGMQSTSDFSVLFENVMHKLLLAAYATADDTWRLFCGTDTVPDFRDSPRYRLGSFGVADDLNENGEFKTKAFPDGTKLVINTGTKGNIIAVTRQAIINDDMGALANMAVAFGRSFGLSIEVGVYALLTANSGLGPTLADSNPFFHSSRANVNATGSALGVDGLEADRVVLGSQKDPSNNEVLNLRPDVLLVPLGLGGSARVLNRMEFDDTSNKFQKPNKVRGLFREIVDTARLTGTRRYLFTNPASVPAIKVVFLEGQGEAPVMEAERGFEVDGMRWKARLDVKPQMFDPKGAVTNAGA